MRILFCRFSGRLTRRVRGFGVTIATTPLPFRTGSISAWSLGRIVRVASLGMPLEISGSGPYIQLVGRTLRGDRPARSFRNQQPLLATGPAHKMRRVANAQQSEALATHDSSAVEDLATRPETFTLSADHRWIERCVRGRDGKVHVTHFALIAQPRKHVLLDSDLANLADAAFLRSTVWPNVHPKASRVRLVDMFSGCGLMTLGVWEACRAIGSRLDPRFALDMDASALAVYSANFPDALTSRQQIEELIDGELGADPTAAELGFLSRVGGVDILVGGPPCQGHSDLNNHTRRDDPKNALYARMARVAELLKPAHVIIENVSAVLHDRGRVVDKTVAWLRRIGYNVDHTIAEIGPLGVPQLRRRHVLVASRTCQFDINRALQRYDRGSRPLGWAIKDLQSKRSEAVFDTTGKASEVNRRRIEYLFRYNRHDLPDSKRPDCHRLKDHSYKSVYGRMYWDRPAQTITSGFISMGQGRYVHPRKHRTITPHEAARIQFVPDFFSFGSTRRTALAQMIGNGVPPKLTYVLALELLR